MFRMRPDIKNFYIERGVAYTEDREVVRQLTISGSRRFLKYQLLKYFSIFGKVEKLHWKKKKRSGSVLFYEATHAAKALYCTKHTIDGHDLYLQASTSWHPTPVEESGTLSAYDLPITDDIWWKVLDYLSLNERLNFAASCERFQAIYELDSHRINHVLNMKDVCTLTHRVIKRLMLLSGKHIHCVTGGPLHLNWPYLTEFVQLLGVSCPNLTELSFFKISVSLAHMTHLFDGANGLINITNISLRRCNLKDAHIYCLQMLSKLKSLDIRENFSIKGDSLKSLPISLEILNVSGCVDLSPKRLIQLAALSHLRELRCPGIVKFAKDNELYGRLAHYCPMLEVLELTDFMNGIQLGGLSRLHTLVIHSSAQLDYHVNNVLLTSIAESYSLRHLEILDSFGPMSDTSFDLSIFSQLKELRTLILHNQNFTTLHLMGLQKLSTLEFLDLSGSPNLSNEVVAKLTKSLSGLRRLKVDFCPLITRQLTKILEGNPKLQVDF